MNKKVSFLDFERESLYNLVGKYQHIVENKKTDSETIGQKQRIWDCITTEYNKNPNVKTRLTKQLKRLWENTKAKRRNKLKSSSTSSLLTTTIKNGSIPEELNEVTENMKFHANEINIQKKCENVKLDNSRSEDEHLDANDSVSQKKSENITYRISHLEEENLDELLYPVISSRVKKVTEATHQQKEIHLLSVQHEQLEIKALEERISQQAELHALKMEQEKEFHQLRLNQEKDLYLQKIRSEQELHQLKLLDYNKLQSSSYSVMYKQ